MLQGLCCSEAPKTGHSTWVEASPVLSRTITALVLLGHIIFYTNQDSINLLKALTRMLAYVQPSVNQQAQVLLHWACSVAWSCCGPNAGYDFLPCSTSYNWPQPITPSWHLCRAFLSSPTQPSVRQPEGALSSLIQIRKTLNRNGPSTEPWGTLVTTHQLDLSPFTTSFYTQTFSQIFT